MNDDSASTAGTNNERDSQLSAMFDNELPETECELLARRLSRDENLQRQWASYSLIGAALRGEPVRARTLASVVRDGKGQVAERVRAVLHEDEQRAVALRAAATASTRRAVPGWLRPLAGAGIAAGVAALSIVLLRQQTEVQATAAVAAPAGATTIVLPGVPSQRLQAAAAVPVAAQALKGSREPESYTVPATRSGDAGIASAQLANYVVAHSEYSGPLARRNLLAALVASESLPVTEPTAPDAAAPAPTASAPAATDGLPANPPAATSAVAPSR